MKPKNLFRLLPLLYVFSTLFVSCTSNEKHFPGKALEAILANPPDTIQISVYWYWISDNISKEGVEKDLESMKKVGINRAFIGYIGQDNVPSGKVKIFSDEWWKVLHVALKKATKLNIEIGIFNSPGWSQSGGPWVKPKEAMRYLTASKLHIKGPQKLNRKLDKPIDLFQDVKVIAYPEPKYWRQVFDDNTGEIASLPEISGLSKITDKDRKTGINFPANGDFIIDFISKKTFTARSLSISPIEKPIDNQVILQVKEKKWYLSQHYQIPD